VGLEDVARVYEPYVARRTLLTLQRLTAITLPDDIERLVEAVYEAPEPDEWKDCLDDDRGKMRAARADDELLAKNRAWRPPTIRDDPFANLEMPFAEDDPEVARMLRAETRLGAASAEIVCLFGSAQAPFLDRALTRPLDLGRTPTLDTVRALAQRTVRVSTRDLVRAIEELPAHATWSDISLLTQRRPLFFGCDPIIVGRHRLQLDDELGLTIHREGGRDAVRSDD
jgi:hypothetical protein